MWFWKVWDVTLIVLGVIWGLGVLVPQILIVLVLLVWLLPPLAIVFLCMMLGALFFIPARLLERFVLRRFIRRRLYSFLVSVVLLLGIWNLYAFADLAMQNRRVAALLADDTGPMQITLPPGSTLAILDQPDNCGIECRILLLKGSAIRVLVARDLPFDASPDLQQPATAWYFEDRASCPEPGEVHLGGSVKRTPSRSEDTRVWEVNYQLRRLAVEGRCLVSSPADLGQANLILGLSDNTWRLHGWGIWGELSEWSQNRSQAFRDQLWQPVDGAVKELYRETRLKLSRFRWSYGRTLILPFPLTGTSNIPDTDHWPPLGLEQALGRSLGLDLTLGPAPPYEEFAALANRMLNTAGEISSLQDQVAQDWVRAMGERRFGKPAGEPITARPEQALYLRIVQDQRFSMPSLAYGLNGAWSYREAEWEAALLAATLERAENPEGRETAQYTINEVILGVSPSVLFPQRERVLRWAALGRNYGANDIRGRVREAEREAGGARAGDSSLCGLAPPGVPCYPLAD